MTVRTSSEDAASLDGAPAVHAMPLATDAPGGPALVFVHGGGFHARVWEPVARRVEQAGRAVAVDLPGHGRSAAPADGDFRWERQGELVLDAVAALGLGRAVLVAHSMGAAIGMLGALTRPDAFAGLWVYEPMVPPTGVTELDDRSRPAVPVHPSRDAVYDRYASRPPMNRLDPETLRIYVEDGFADREDGQVELRCPPELLSALGRDWADHGAFARLGELAGPVVVAHGAADHYQAEWAPMIAARIPGARVEAFSHLSHLGPLEDPAAIAASIDRFLGGG